jgi:hypothetical protein
MRKRGNYFLKILASMSLFTALLLFAGGCSTFNYAWHFAQQTSPPKDLQGRWQGDCVRQVTGHKTLIRWIVTKLDDTTYQARFTPNTAKAGSSSPSTTPSFEGCETDDALKFTGDADLGALAGGLSIITTATPPAPISFPPTPANTTTGLFK